MEAQVGFRSRFRFQFAQIIDPLALLLRALSNIAAFNAFIPLALLNQIFLKPIDANLFRQGPASNAHIDTI